MDIGLLRRIFEWLQTLPRWHIITLSIMLAVLIGAVDYLTGSEIGVSVFYLLPVTISTWFVNRRIGVFIAFISALVWLLADLSGDREYSIRAVPYWNALIRLSFFLVVTLTLAALRVAQARREELSQFIVHDLRSPLSNVLSGLELLSELQESNASADEKQLVSLSVASSNQMLSLINELLDLAKLESGKLMPTFRVMPVAELFDKALAQVSLLSAQKQVRIQTQITEEANTVCLDEDLSIRVLVNLLNNALKHSPHHSIIQLSATGSGVNDNQLVVAVRDQGKGIPKEWTTRIFDKFSQIETYKAGFRVGSGLGLSFCRQAIEAQGGRIWLESEIDRGTTVYFTLPNDTKHLNNARDT